MFQIRSFVGEKERKTKLEFSLENQTIPGGSKFITRSLELGLILVILENLLLDSCFGASDSFWHDVPARTEPVSHH